VLKSVFDLQCCTHTYAFTHNYSKIERIVLANAKEYAENMLQAILADDTNQWGGGSLFSRGKAQFTAGGSSSTATAAAAADAAMNAAAADNCTADSTCTSATTAAAAATAIRSSGIKRGGVQGLLAMIAPNRNCAATKQC
jgi:hypothetical protein